MQLGRLSDAARQYEAVLKIDASRVGKRVHLAIVYQQLGRIGDAIEQAQIVLQSRPENLAIRSFCEKLIASRGGQAN